MTSEHKLPIDVHIGSVIFRKGIDLDTLILAARRWYEQACKASLPVTGGEDDTDWRSWCLALCTLLDRIERARSQRERDELLRQRFRVAEQHGMTVVFGPQGSAETH